MANMGRCTTCGGSGSQQQTCRRCGGKAILPWGEEDASPPRCGQCQGGRVTVTCTSCGGSGKK